MATAAVALVLTTRLSRDYVETLERSLLRQGVDVDMGEVMDTTTRSTMLRTLTELRRQALPAPCLKRRFRLGPPGAGRRGPANRRAAFTRP